MQCDVITCDVMETSVNKCESLYSPIAWLMNATAACASPSRSFLSDDVIIAFACVNSGDVTLSGFELDSCDVSCDVVRWGVGGLDLG